jgi:xanthine dehydrogenase iron-sulfur cluster and FAD-binding subunit A
MEAKSEFCSDLLFFLNGKKVVEPNPDPDQTLLQYLRSSRALLLSISGHCNL